MMLSMFCGHVPRGYIQFLPRVLHFGAVHWLSFQAGTGDMYVLCVCLEDAYI